jgi:hypothetical protein
MKTLWKFMHTAVAIAAVFIVACTSDPFEIPVLSAAEG